MTLIFSRAVSLAVCAACEFLRCSRVPVSRNIRSSCFCDFFEKSWPFSVLDSTPKNSHELHGLPEEGHEVTWGWNWKPWKVWFSNRRLKQKWDVYATQICWSKTLFSSRSYNTTTSNYKLRFWCEPEAIWCQSLLCLAGVERWVLNWSTHS